MQWLGLSVWPKILLVYLRLSSSGISKSRKKLTFHGFWLDGLGCGLTCYGQRR